MGGTASALTLTGDFNFTGTYSQATRLNVTFNGSGDQAISSAIVPANCTWRSLIVNKSAARFPWDNTNHKLDEYIYRRNMAYTNAGAQSVLTPSTGIYPGNLTLSGGGNKNPSTGTTSNTGSLTLSGTVSTTTTAALNIGGNLVVGDGTLLLQPALT